jgi:hypothetical protein
MTTGKARGRRVMLAMASVGTLVFGLASPALADQPSVATGTFTLVNLASRTTTLEKTVDGNSFSAVSNETPSYSGGLTGVAVDNYELIVHPDGSLNGQGTETCETCTIGGRTGSYTAVFAFQGTAAGVVGRLTFQSATGGLVGLHGGGTFQGTSSGTYAFDFLFSP